MKRIILLLIVVVCIAEFSETEKYFRKEDPIYQIEGRSKSRIAALPSMYEELEKGEIQYENTKAAEKIRHYYIKEL